MQEQGVAEPSRMVDANAVAEMKEILEEKWAEFEKLPRSQRRGSQSSKLGREKYALPNRPAHSRRVYQELLTLWSDRREAA